MGLLSVFYSVAISGLVSDLRSPEFGFEEATNLRAMRWYSTVRYCPHNQGSQTGDSGPGCVLLF